MKKISIISDNEAIEQFKIILTIFRNLLMIKINE